MLVWWVQCPAWAEEGGVAVMAVTAIVGARIGRACGWQDDGCCRGFWEVSLHAGAATVPTGKGHVGSYHGGFPWLPVWERGMGLAI